MAKVEKNNFIAGFAAVLLVMAATWRPPVPEPRVGFDLIFQFSVFCLLAVVLWIGTTQGRRPPSLRATAGCKWWALFLMLAFVSRIVAFYTLGKLSIVSYVAFFSVVCGVLWFFLLVMFVDTGKGVTHLMDAICIIALFNVLFLIFQHFTIDPLWKPRGGGEATSYAHSVGLMSDRNNASALLAFCFPAFLRFEPKTICHIKQFTFPIYWWPYLGIFVLLGLIRTTSCGGAVALFAGLLCYAMFLPWQFHYKIWLLLILVVAIGFFFVFVDKPKLSSTSSSRFRIAKQGIELYKKQPVLGAGLGQWKVTFLRVLKEKKFSGLWWSHAHNEYIQALYELGTGFMIILGGYLISIARRITRQAAISVTALVIIMVNCLINFPFHVATTAIVAITWLAILECELKEKKKCAKAR